MSASAMAQILPPNPLVAATDDSTWADWLYNAATGHISPSQMASMEAQATAQAVHAANVAIASGADPSAVSAVLQRTLATQNAQLEAVAKGADAAPLTASDLLPGGGMSWVFWLALAGVGAYLVLK